MRSISHLLKTVERFTSQNSPVLLTGLGVAGIFTTAVLTGKATIVATRIVDDLRIQFNDEGEPEPVRLEAKEIVQQVWKLYIPSLVSAALTVTCVITSNRIGARRTAAMAAAYTIAERSFEEYRDKIVERLGEKDERKVRDEIQQDRITANPPPEKMGALLVAAGDIICYDKFSDRYFKSNHQSLLSAQNLFNYRLINDDAQSLNDFYRILELPPIKMGDQVGWTSMEKLELVITAVHTPEMQPATAIDFLYDPKEGYSSAH